MKVLVWYFLFSIVLFAQPFKTGIHVPIYLTGNYISAGTGLNLTLEYEIPKNYSIKSLLGYEPPFCFMNKHLGRYLYGSTYVEMDFKYSFIGERDFPFIEIGAGYYIHNTNPNGNITYYNGEQMTLKDLKNNLGLNLAIGVEFHKKSNFHFIASIKGTYMITDYTMELYNNTLKSYYNKTETLDLSSVKLSLGFVFNL